MRSKFLAAIISMMMVVALAMPGFAAQTTDPKTFVFVTMGDVDSLDPAYAYDTASGEIIHQLYDNLIAYEGSSLDKFVPMLATQVPTKENGLISKDGLTIKFPIRKGVKFHNGDILTPADVEYTFERAMISDPAGGPVWMFFEPLLGVQTMKELVAKVGGPKNIDDMTKVTRPSFARRSTSSIRPWKSRATMSYSTSPSRILRSCRSLPRAAAGARSSTRSG